MDLDQFKQVNDTLGHTRGDMLLKAVAERLQSTVRDADVIARFGGDEFVILQAPLHSLEQGEALAARVLKAVSGTYDLDGHKVVVTASIGIALATTALDPDQFLRNADMALYWAKAEGRGTWRWFETKMEANALARRNLELDLRHALESEAFELHYQPLFNLKTKRIMACEALLRWPHRERGMVSPAEFIPVAEEMGLIVEIGNFVLREACLECAKWPDDVRVAVNMSPIQFRRGNVAEGIRAALSAANLPASRLEIEITESVFLNDTDLTRHWLDELQEMGVRISLDDFGTGYSSLSYLHNYPLNKVKIDRSFLQGVDTSHRSLNLLRSVARLSADLGMSVAVEGIETEEQFNLVAQESSVEEVQGFLFGAAMPSSDIRAMLFAPPVRISKVA
jgi:diguanylate cyclase (GGDEF)-like protein